MSRLIQMKAHEDFKKGDTGFINMMRYNASIPQGVVFKQSSIAGSTQHVSEIAIATKKCSKGEIIPWSLGGLTKLGTPDTGDAKAPLYLDITTDKFTDIEPTNKLVVGMILRPGVAKITSGSIFLASGNST